MLGVDWGAIRKGEVAFAGASRGLVGVELAAHTHVALIVRVTGVVLGLHLLASLCERVAVAVLIAISGKLTRLATDVAIAAVGDTRAVPESALVESLFLVAQLARELHVGGEEFEERAIGLASTVDLIISCADFWHAVLPTSSVAAVFEEVEQAAISGSPIRLFNAIDLVKGLVGKVAIHKEALGLNWLHQRSESQK